MVEVQWGGRGDLPCNVEMSGAEARFSDLF